MASLDDHSRVIRAFVSGLLGRVGPPRGATLLAMSFSLEPDGTLTLKVSMQTKTGVVTETLSNADLLDHHSDGSLAGAVEVLRRSLAEEVPLQ